MKQPPYSLGRLERRTANKVIREVCEHRGYTLHALNVRTNHIHLVVGCGDTPEKAMNCFKAYITRRLRSKNLVGPDRKVWSRHGSTKYLWTEEQVEEAIGYVVHGQGPDLP
ncbi:MAG: transposase [Aridibacter famidurans]|nr:transposase [Aridibacter famidurans]